MTYQYDNYSFHYVVENGICYLCMSDQLNKHRIPFAFLNDMKQRFLATYGNEEPLTAIAFAYNEEFSHVIKNRMEFFNSEEADRSIDNIGAVKSQIEDVKSTMVQNIESLLERGEKIELLVDRTENLRTSSFLFEAVETSAALCIGERCAATLDWLWLLLSWRSLASPLSAVVSPFITAVAIINMACRRSWTIPLYYH
jgi:hypothetical protein